ncbi:transposase [Metarhizobium album]|uniref:Transposase n=1 Tax=Metarhizobium album TaxID=2182425 RepID=A0A2U2DFF6_9HYPH|nr:transposase domain-containing protein [Rhizobium album]PWE52053.1 transposase [Rhizobium album]
MREWYSIAELAGLQLPGLPTSEKGLDKKARAEWRANPQFYRVSAGKTKSFVEYHIRVLPEIARQRLCYGQAQEDAGKEQRRQLLWQRFERLSKEHKEICEKRLAVLREVLAMVTAGHSAKQAVDAATAKAGVRKSAYYEWRQMVEGYPQQDWLAALGPAFSPAVDGIASPMADCHPMAWSFIKSDFLRPEKPAFSACYRRMQEAAEIQGWAPIPSERSLRRRMDAEVPEAVQVVARQSKERARKLHPAQRRTRAHLHAMQAVNMDGHELDLHVRVPWRTKPTRMYLVGIQDLYSNTILSWRLAEAETWEVVRLVVGDMVEKFGIPEDMYIDNGRAFASKKISGGARTRYRFKIREEDPEGLLVALKITPHFVKPRSGQSKPIERAWGDFAENISKHPICSGAYTGKNPTAKPSNYMQSAIDLEDLKQLVAHQVEEHNARTGRRTEVAKKRSFAEVFAESMRLPSTIVRQPTAAQRALWLLASEPIKTQKGSGEIHLLGNRYWNVALNQHMGKQVIIRFDPDQLSRPLKVYDIKNRLICEADCIDDTGFASQDDARIHARRVADYNKALKIAHHAEAALSAEQLGAILLKGRKSRPQEPTKPAVPRLATSNLAVLPQPAEAISDHEFETSFSRALTMVRSGAVLEFPTGNTSASAGQTKQSRNVKSAVPTKK